jgi:hypothetical protein
MKPDPRIRSFLPETEEQDAEKDGEDAHTHRLSLLENLDNAVQKRGNPEEPFEQRCKHESAYNGDIDNLALLVLCTRIYHSRLTSLTGQGALISGMLASARTNRPTISFHTILGIRSQDSFDVVERGNKRGMRLCPVSSDYRSLSTTVVVTQRQLNTGSQPNVCCDSPRYKRGTVKEGARVVCGNGSSAVPGRWNAGRVTQRRLAIELSHGARELT